MSVSIPTIKSRASLREVVAEHVPLTRRGATLWGLCPFHDERTPSLAVHAGYWYCHGCHETGDVIDFTARINRVSKGRAIRMLAERYGVEPGAPVTRAEGQYMRDIQARAEFWWARRRALALDSLERACAVFFADQTTTSESRAAAAGAYLRMLDSISPAVRGRVFLALRTTEDNRAWAEEQKQLPIREAACASLVGMFMDQGMWVGVPDVGAAIREAVTEDPQ